MPNTEADDAARVRCLYCGANNFPTSAVCWQCGRPIKAAPTSQAAPGISPPGTVFPMAAQPSVRELSLAPKAAAALGMLFPYIGLPVGIVFLMCDDPRRTQIGWQAIGWSLLGSVINGIALAGLLVPALALLKNFLHPGGGAAPTGLPSIPGMGSDGTELLLPWHFAALFASIHV